MPKIISPRELRRIRESAKRSAADRGGQQPAASQSKRGNGHTLVKLLEDLEDDNEADAVFTYFGSGGWVDDPEEKKFTVKGFGAFGTHETGTRGFCFTSGDIWFFAIPWVCPEDE